MAKQTINIGSAPNDGTGDTARDAFDKVNDNFDELYAAGYIAAVSEDTTPSLGGDLDVSGNAIVSTAAGDIAITPDTTGSVIIDGLSWPQADGTDGQVLTTDGAGNLAFETVSGGGGASQLSDLSDVGVTTPTNRNVLVADGDSWESRALVEADISDLGSYLTSVEGTDVLSTGPVTDGYVLTADGAGGAAWEAAAGGVDWSTTQTTTGNITFELSDNAGSSKLSILDSDSVEVAYIDSNGVIDVTGTGDNGRITLYSTNSPNAYIQSDVTGYEIELYNRYASTPRMVVRDTIVSVASNTVANTGFVIETSTTGDGTFGLKFGSGATPSGQHSINGNSWTSPFYITVPKGQDLSETNSRHAVDFQILMGGGGDPDAGTTTGGNAGKFDVILGAAGAGFGGAADGSEGVFRVLDEGSANSIFEVYNSGATKIARAFTVATLPTGAVGMVARVTDADTPAVGSTVTGGGASAALVWYNGTNWVVTGGDAPAGGVDWSTTQTTTGNFTFELSDNAGSSKLSILDSDSAEVASIDSNGVARFGSGSEGTPSISFASDTDTGFYTDSATIRFAVSGSQVASANAQGYFTVRQNGFLGINTFTPATNATNLIQISNGTPGSAAVAGTIGIQARDSSDGSANSTLSLLTEQAVEAIGTFTATHKLKIWINGTEYWIQLDAV